jgi:benzoate/toluate 1,2-dioxygenase subunit beta
MGQESVASFLYREARLMDEHRYEEWLALWDRQATYWVPCGDETADPRRQVSIIYDDRQKLGDRIARFLSGDVIAQEPRTPMRRLVSNIDVFDENEEEVSVRSNFLLVQVVGSEQEIWCGETTHGLKRNGAGFLIKLKKVTLVNRNIEMPSLQFIV